MIVFVETFATPLLVLKVTNPSDEISELFFDKMASNRAGDRE